MYICIYIYIYINDNDNNDHVVHLAHEKRSGPAG